uniref:serine/threonine-protein kinase haspin n=1 Tax=Oncorhynchus gorbuscha TaxID=8017 RepID=UPI001EAF89C3|nr:serine/threonine-protein kinase haspin [Oncorhynchus gorbuscha]
MFQVSSLSDSIVLGTPVRGNRLHLSSLLVNLTPETYTWSRLKAALSLHRKTKAFLTPKRPLYLLSSPEAELGDVSQKLFSTPRRTPRPPNLRSTIRGSTPLSVYSLAGELSDDQKVFSECNQTGPLSFQDCLPAARMKLCRKVGEGTFGEVFSTTNTSGDAVALKIIPVEGCDQVNGEEQKTFGEILHEIIISKELSSLKEKKHNQTTGFIGLKDLHCVKGCYPPSLLKAWDSFNTQRGSENDRPDFFNEEQLFLILEFEFGGRDLENSNGQLASVMVSKSILHQVTAALAVAEQELCFEHRDLHWGNVLVQSTKEKEGSFLLNGTNHSLETRGVSVRIIDYSLSRLEIDGLTVSCDISEDEELFQGHGDLQFDIYRLMRQENGNKWGDYQPHSNVLWLHYLSSKLLTMTYKGRGGRGVKQARLDLQRFHDDVLIFRSASDILYNCGLFQ